jgi:hypothetical protein
MHTCLALAAAVAGPTLVEAAPGGHGVGVAVIDLLDGGLVLLQHREAPADAGTRISSRRGSAGRLHCRRQRAGAAQKCATAAPAAVLALLRRLCPAHSHAVLGVLWREHALTVNDCLQLVDDGRAFPAAAAPPIMRRVCMCMSSRAVCGVASCPGLPARGACLRVALPRRSLCFGVCFGACIAPADRRVCHRGGSIRPRVSMLVTCPCALYEKVPGMPTGSLKLKGYLHWVPASALMSFCSGTWTCRAPGADELRCRLAHPNAGLVMRHETQKNAATAQRLTLP